MIDNFKYAYAFLSNFEPCSVSLGDEHYPSVEHAYQAAKTVDPHERAAIQAAPTAGAAKRLGKEVTLRPDWESVRLHVMEELVFAKFVMNRRLKKLLLATGDAELVEGNHWGDTFWGVCRGKGENHLGKILMRTRAWLRANAQ